MKNNRIIYILLMILLFVWDSSYAQTIVSTDQVSKKLTKKELKQQKKAEKEAKKREKQKKLMLLKPGESAMKIKKDTAEVEDNPFAVITGVKHIPIDSVRLRGVVNPDTFILDRRYIAEGDSVHTHWYDNLFLMLGGGAEKMVPPSGNSYHFDPLTTAHLGLGIQLGKYNALRLTLQGGLGYQKDYDRMFTRYGGRLDHQFDLTSYFNGYNPTRLLGIQTVLGMGYHHVMLNKMKGLNGNAYEGHAGLQLYFNTGPHGTFNIEPYFGLASDDYDLSQQLNWRKMDFFYGVNLSYVYYFSNHLTRAARSRLLEEARHTRNEVIGDTLKPMSWRLHAWQAPLIFEVAAGPYLAESPQLSRLETMGHEITFSIGKWFSPVIGVRLSVEARSAKWLNLYKQMEGVEHEQAMYNHFYGGRLEAMFNPLGFTHNYLWNSNFGVYLIGGLEYGKFIKYDAHTLNCPSEAYTVGLHLWAQLSDGLQFFIEPRFIHNVYKIPYTNVQWNHRYSDNGFGANIGLTILEQGKHYRKKTVNNATHVSDKWTVGIGGGTNLIHIQDQYMGDSHLNLNASGFLQYAFSHVSSLRLGIEYMTHSKSDYTKFIDVNMLAEKPQNTRTVRNGQWNHTYYLGMISLDYNINLSNFMRGYLPKRLFELEAFAGPSMAYFFGQTGELSKRELLREGHEASSLLGIKRGAYIAGNAGVKLVANVSKHFGITLIPQLFCVPTINLQAIHITRSQLLETLDLGIQYKF